MMTKHRKRMCATGGDGKFRTVAAQNRICGGGSDFSFLDFYC